MLRDAVYIVCDWNSLDDVRHLYQGHAIVAGLTDDGAIGTHVELLSDFPGVLARRPRFALYLDPDDTWFNSDSVRGRCGGRSDSTMMFLISPSAAPQAGVRPDGMVNSFICAPQILADAFLRHRPTAGQPTLCYNAVLAALDQRQPVRFRVASGDSRKFSRLASISEKSIAVIIPHRGELRRLESCLKQCTVACPKGQFFVGIDEVVTLEHLAIVDAFPEVEFFAVAPTHVGPYVIRQFFIETCQADFVAFQDSDDVSCVDRLEVQIETALQTGADFVGCHELRVDEYSCIVEAIRFPFDVNAALTNISYHVQLFPTTVARRDALIRLGGFSTRRRYASDRELLLRAILQHRVVNCDEFLYVRFRHEGSLTTSPKSASGTRYRKRFAKIWEQDSTAVRNGDVAIANSSLRPRHLHGKTYEFKNLRTGHTWAYRPSHQLTCAS